MMATANVITLIPQINFPFKIVNISKLKEALSSEVMVNDIPWKIEVKKSKLWLSVYLHCAKENSTNWSHLASATFKLVPLSGNKGGIEHNTNPYVFDDRDDGFGVSTFITWDQLLKPANHYVKDDILTLDITIVVVDPNYKNPSKVILETIEESCVESCFSKYKMTVDNISKLMAAESPKFRVRSSSWRFVVSKGDSGFCIILHNKSTSLNFSCDVRMSVKHISSKKYLNRTISMAKLFKKGATLQIHSITFEDLMKPENGYVNNNSIVVEIEIRTGVCVQGAISSNQNVSKRLKMECSVCLEVFGTQEVSITKCGHLFCTDCITKSINAHKKCPFCNVAADLDELRRVYMN